MSTYTVSVSKEIEAGSQFIYHLLCDYVHGHPNILPTKYFEQVEVEHGGFGEGTVIKVQMKIMSLKNEMRLHISEPIPGEVLQEEDRDNGVITQFHISPSHRNKSIVTIHTTWIKKNGIKGIIEKWIVRTAAKKIYKEELDLIRNYCLQYDAGPK